MKLEVFKQEKDEKLVSFYMEEEDGNIQVWARVGVEHRLLIVFHPGDYGVHAERVEVSPANDWILTDENKRISLHSED